MSARASAPADTGTLGAVVLAGGLARRMGGIDKGLVELDGRPMIAHVIDAIRPEVDALVISANRNAERYAALGAPVVADRDPGRLGPLAGLAAGIAALATRRTLLCPCDSPFVRPTLVRRLAEACRAPDVDIAVADDGTRLQPVFCVVESARLGALEDFLARGERKIDRWFAEEAVRAVDCSDLAGCFRNVNTEDERLAAEALLVEGRREGRPARA